MRLVDISTLSEMLGLPKSWIYERTRASCPAMIPHFKLGKYLRFDPDSPDFIEWLASLSRNKHNRPREKDGTMEAESMTRSTFQKGSVRKRERKNRTVYELRYRMKEGAKWTEKTEHLENCKTDKEARKAANKRMQIINAINNGSGFVTVNAFAETRWISYLKKKKPSTLYHQQHLFDKHVKPVLGTKQLIDIKPGDIADLLESKKKLENSSLLELYSIIRGFFELAIQYDLMPTNPVRSKLHRPSVARKKKPVLTLEQLQRLFANIPPDYWLLFAVLAITVLRIGEVLALRWQNFDFDRDTLSITHTLWKSKLQTPKTQASAKSFQIPPVFAELLQKHRMASKFNADDDFIFCGKDARPICYNTLRRYIWQEALKASGVEIKSYQHGFHLLRHSGATLLYLLTKDLKLVQDHARHSQISVTSDLYIHSEGLSGGESASETISNALFGGLTVVQNSNKVN
jgi:integrase